MALQVFGVQDGRTGHVGSGTGPLQRFPLKSLIGDAPIRLRQSGELVEYRLSAWEVEALCAYAPGNLAENAPIRIFVAFGTERGPEKLHSPFDVRVCAVPVRECH